MSAFRKKRMWHFLSEPIENVILTATKMCRVFPLNRKKWRKVSFFANTRILPCDYASFSNCYTPKSIFLSRGTCSQSSAIQMENTRWELEWKSLQFSAGSQCKFCQCCSRFCSCMMQETGWEMYEWNKNTQLLMLTRCWLSFFTPHEEIRSVSLKISIYSKTAIV